MRPLKRGFVNKSRSAGKFRRDSQHSKAANMARAPMRGGWRL